MEFIKTSKLGRVFEKRDESGQVIYSKSALRDISIEIESGSFVALVGHNGSGKSTLARHLNALLLPSEGTVWIDGKDTGDPENIPEIRRTVGMVFQNPDNQIIADVVEEDVAFGPENLGVPTEEIWERVATALSQAGIEECRYLSPGRLSGGQKQRVAIAGILAMKPSCIVLDEATSMLDPLGRKSVMDAVIQLRDEAGLSIVLITHYMEEAALADRVIVMEEGRVLMDGSPKDILSDVKSLEKLHLEAPPAARLAERLKERGMELPSVILFREECLRAILDARESFSAQTPSEPRSETEASEGKAFNPEGDEIIRAEKLSYSYARGLSYEKQAVKDLSFSIKKGSITGIIGNTGSGKTTLLQLLDGLIKPTEGKVCFRGKDIWGRNIDKRALPSKIAMVFQYPEHQLFGETVLADVMFGPKNTGMDEETAKRQAEKALKALGVEPEDFEKSPFELSGGQKRRAAIAGVIAMEPEVLVLDEPMAGLDSSGRKELIDCIMDMRREKGTTVLWSSHSMEDMAEYADRILVMEEGSMVRDGSPQEVFRDVDFLESIGLGAPEAVYIAGELRKAGMEIPEELITVDQAARAIIQTMRNSRNQ